ncbi:hypothetical protein, partial [Xenorhabdus sp. Sc-CR9]|uniref:hypothetical protein n=1 Tax=Xenorhabdus sp. Sc-CR9 TaxID=2584468 RepID=UPI001F3F7519
MPEVELYGLIRKFTGVISGDVWDKSVPYTHLRAHGAGRIPFAGFNLKKHNLIPVNPSDPNIPVTRIELFRSRAPFFHPVHFR